MDVFRVLVRRLSVVVVVSTMKLKKTLTLENFVLLFSNLAYLIFDPGDIYWCRQDPWFNHFRILVRLSSDCIHHET